MQKEFNDTGLCIPNRHYMVDNSDKLKQIIALVEKGKYFTINRPRQFGKTTTLFLLANQLNLRDDCVALKISFEGIDTDSYQNQAIFISIFLDMLIEEFEFLQLSELVDFTRQHVDTTPNLRALSRFITKLKRDRIPKKSVVLLIDEVDKSSNNQLFLDFLSMLRDKYLQQHEGRDHSFQSVILAGVHDIKTLKRKIRPDESSGYNSPWNIAIDFKVDLSFAPHEIETMLQDYSLDKQIQFDISAIAEQLYYYTSGYPYLVSKLCKLIDEEIVPNRADKNWLIDDVETAFKMIVKEGYTTTLFDSLIKNLENNQELYELIFHIVINGKSFNFTIADPVINLAHLYGILKPTALEHCQIHNRIFEQRVYAYMMSKFMRSKYGDINGFGGPEYVTTEGLDIKLILQRFQAFMRENHAKPDRNFLEREGRLLFLAFLKPILNGRGFEFKEPVVADERRMDLVITYQNQRYVIELKRWYGEKYHQKGLQQLSDYLDMYSLKKGYLLIYDFNKGKIYKEEKISFQDKEIFAVWV
ncbi:AAA-like domain-containing protein [Candidatus Parabeggiatoa sp. HSG14]|uniref:AAA family ATPase n=1 Tax=Candidatus Parabeggiatoa sp. HSG14 TaxID=3055593 RepID=UPI0025A89581|nr:AAA family ATPase [Thiotrichales bacterium HSG14]